MNALTPIIIMINEIKTPIITFFVDTWLMFEMDIVYYLLRDII